MMNSSSISQAKQILEYLFPFGDIKLDRILADELS